VAVAVCAAFANVLAAGRPQFNARVAEAKRRTPGFPEEAFAAFLQTGVDRLIAAVDAIAPERGARVALAAFDAALTLCAHGLAGPGSRCPPINRLWAEVLPRLAQRIAEAPADALGALSNAVVHLAGNADVRTAEWLDRMAALGPRAASLTQLLDLGKVLAWRAGAAHYRTGALTAADALPPELALAAVGADASAAWPEVRAAFIADPWWSPDGQGLRSRAAGAFSGFGGSFVEPPELRTAPEGFWVRSGNRHRLLLADAWGAVLLPATAEEFEASADQGLPPALTVMATQHGCRLFFAITRTMELDLPAESLRVRANADTVAVASPYSHVIQLFALR
jgi:hypothetical protein